MDPSAFPEHFSLAIDEANEPHVVYLSGELDIASALALEGLLVETPGSTVIADLAGLTFIDSSGIAALVRAQIVIEADGNELVFRGPLQANVVRVLQIAGLDGLIQS